MKVLSTKSYLIRAIYEWCADSGLTPYLSVHVDQTTRVPMEYVREGEIVLNISMDATRNITLGGDLIQFSARFNGVSCEISVPTDNVTGVFARENGQGLFFAAESANDQKSAVAENSMIEDQKVASNSDEGTTAKPIKAKTHLQVIK